MAVPKVVVNETTQFEGAQPDNVFIENIFSALESNKPEE
jgi:hypothetical protein